MKLYYVPGACSLAVHIALRELGLEFQLERVDLSAKTTEGGRSFLEINPKGYVPALEIQPGLILTEGVALQQYLASRKPEREYLPRFGTLEYFQAVEWLTYVSSEMHKGIGALFGGPNPKVVERLQSRFAFLNQRLDKHDFLGPQFGAADAYLFTVLRWTEPLQIDLSGYPALQRFMERVGSRPRVREALEAEGLLARA